MHISDKIYLYSTKFFSFLFFPSLLITAIGMLFYKHSDFAIFDISMYMVVLTVVTIFLLLMNLLYTNILDIAIKNTYISNLIGFALSHVLLPVLFLQTTTGLTEENLIDAIKYISPATFYFLLFKQHVETDEAA